MSTTAEGWAWKQDCPTASAKLVLVCLGWFANHEGDDAFPSISTLCLRTCLTEKTILKALRELEALGLLERERRKGSDGRKLSTMYRLNLQYTLPVKLPQATGNSTGRIVSKKESKESNNARTRSRARPADPRITVAGEGERPEDHGRPMVRGWFLDSSYAAMIEAAHLDPATASWKPAIDWMWDSIDPDLTILPAIREAMKRLGNTSVHSLAYFDKPVREHHRKQVRDVA